MIDQTEKKSIYKQIDHEDIEKLTKHVTDNINVKEISKELVLAIGREGGYCLLTNSEIATKYALHYHERTIQLALQELIAFGYLTRHKVKATDKRRRRLLTLINENHRTELFPACSDEVVCEFSKVKSISELASWSDLYSKIQAEKFLAYHRATGWKNRDGQSITDWQQAARLWVIDWVEGESKVR